MPEREIMMEGQCLVLSLMLPVPILFMDVQSQYSRSLIRSTTSCGYDKSRRVAIFQKELSFHILASLVRFQMVGFCAMEIMEPQT